MMTAFASPLARFDMQQFKFSPNLTEDENYMDIVMIITRTSHLRQGSMGCILVQPSTKQDGSTLVENDSVVETNSSYSTKRHGDHDTKDKRRDDEVYNSTLMKRIIAAATNTSLFTSNDSDIHAEINAIGQVARCQRHMMIPSTSSSTHTQGATAYITMPPCKKCFGALYASGITRIVSRRTYPTILQSVASKVEIQLITLKEEELASQKVRLEQYFSQNIPTKNESLIENDEKLEEREKKMAKLDTCGYDNRSY